MNSKIKTGGRAVIKKTGHVAHKRRLAARGWTNRRAAEFLNINVSYLSEVLNGHETSKRLLKRVWEIPQKEEVQP